MSGRRARGFTLLEALVTLVIVALIVAALMQALTQALAMRTALIRYQRENREGALQEMWFRESVAGAVADLHDGYGPLKGNAQGFDLVTFAPLAGDALVRARWSLERTEGRMALRYRDARAGDIVVIDGPLERASFEYLDADGEWQPSWTPEPDEDAIPRAIRFSARTATRHVRWTVAIVAGARTRDTLRLQEEPANAF